MLRWLGLWPRLWLWLWPRLPLHLRLRLSCQLVHRGVDMQVGLALVELPACLAQAKRLRLFPGAQAAILCVKPEAAKALLVHCVVVVGTGGGCLKLAENNAATCGQNAFCRSSEKTFPRLISLGIISPNPQI